MDNKLDKRKVEALVVVSLSTVILIVCFSMGLVLLGLQALETKLEMGAEQPVHVMGSAARKRMASNEVSEAIEGTVGRAPMRGPGDPPTHNWEVRSLKGNGPAQKRSWGIAVNCTYVRLIR